MRPVRTETGTRAPAGTGGGTGTGIGPEAGTGPEPDAEPDTELGAEAGTAAAPRTDAEPDPDAGRAAPAGPSRARGRRPLDLAPETVERDLVALVLTVVELLRQLMERQALRRFDTGELSEEQEERIGLTLMLLEERMTELREHYGLRPEDLNLDLGPLGPLLPRD